jgi:hypothetical protein
VAKNALDESVMTQVAVNQDQLGESVTRHLSRSYRNWFSTSPWRCGILSVLTLGLWPLLRLRRQFRNYVSFERQQLWYLGEWARTRLGGEEASAFADAAKKLEYRETIQWLQTWCLIGIGLVMCAYVTGDGLLGELWDRTFGFFQLSSNSNTDEVWIPFAVWNVGLGLAYLFHWYQIRRYARRSALVVKRFDAVAAREIGAAGVANPQALAAAREPKLRWIAIGLILAGLGALWAVPMVLAALAQRRYINEDSARSREILLTRVRSIQQQARPLRNHPTYTVHGPRCENPLCQANLPMGAQFCPRCGRRLAMSQVA